MLSPDLSFVVPSISRDMRALYDAHFSFVWRYMAHRGVPTVSIDDLVHNVFRIVREHPSRHDPARSRCVLVCMIARQVLREFRKRHASLAQKPDGLLELENDGATQTFSRHAAVQMLDAVLERLTEMQREVILLCDGEKLCARDVGDALGLPESTVELRLDSARRNMDTLVSRLRTHPLWASLDTASRDAAHLLDAAQLARTPTDRDRERVFAAMLASSMTNRQGPADLPQIVEMSAAQRTRDTPIPTPLSTPLPQPSMRTTHRVPRPPARKGTGVMWGAALLAGITIGVASYAVVASTRTSAQSDALAPGALTITARPEQTADAPPKLVEAVQNDSTPNAAEPVPNQADQPAEESAQAEPSPAAAQEALAAEPAAPEAPTDAREAPASTPTLKVSPARTRARAARSARAQQRANNEEARQLFAAERALKAGEAQLALEMIDNHAKLYPESALSTERSALRAQILCETGRTRAARRIVLELEAAQADKPLLAAVDQACMHR